MRHLVGCRSYQWDGWGWATSGQPLAISINSGRGQGRHRAEHFLQHAFYQCLPQYMHICSRCQNCDTRQDGRGTLQSTRGDARLQSSRARPRTWASPLDHGTSHRGPAGQNVRVLTKGVHPRDIGTTDPEMHVSVHSFGDFLVQVLWHLFPCPPSDHWSPYSVGTGNGLRQD